MLLLRLAAAFSVMILPGAWLVYARPAAWLPSAARIAVAGALSPIVVAAQFYFLRLTGVPVGLTAWIIFAINVPAIALIRRHWPRERPARAAIGEWSFVFGLLALAIAIPWFVVDQLRIYYGHTWLHGAIIGQFDAGALVPEEPELAGVRLAYPWLSHVYWAALGRILEWAPTRVFAFTNAIWMVWVTLAVYAMGRILGARGFAARAGVLALALGTNALGAIVWYLTRDLPGDIRYTPWLRKFMVFNDMPFALALFGALTVLAVVAIKRSDGRHPGIFGAALAGVGVVYPPILPAALAVSGLAVVLVWWKGSLRDAAAYAGAAIAAASLSAGVLAFTIAARDTSGVGLSTAEAFVSKLVSAAIVLAIPIVCIVVVMTIRLRQKLRMDSTHLVLIAAAIATVLAGAVFNLNEDAFNEYKLMLCAAMLLAPFVALACDRAGSPAVPLPLVVIVIGVMLSPMVLMVNPSFGLAKVANVPAAVERGRAVELADEAADAGWTRVIREQTPADTVVVALTADLFIPGITARSLYAPVVGKPFPAYWLESREHMIGLRGYARTLVEDRISNVDHLFAEGPARAIAWNRIAALGRPVAVLTSTMDQRALVEWWTSQGIGPRLYEDRAGHVVLFCPREQLPILTER